MYKCGLCEQTFNDHTSFSQHIFAAHGAKRLGYVGWGSGVVRSLLCLLTIP